MLFFDHTRIPEGYYYKDHRSSPDREFEFIEFDAPVNIREVEAYINFYEGRLNGPATGEIRVEFEDRIYSGPFTIAATSGNRGRRGAGQEDHWTRVDILDVLGLTPGRIAQRTLE